MQNTALQTQVGGSHYKQVRIQPVEFAQKNGWDFCSASALKYLIRHALKDGLKDLQKARHFGELRAELIPNTNWKFLRSVRAIFSKSNNSNVYAIPMTAFISANDISIPEETAALLALDAWVRGVDADGTGYFTCIDTLIRKAYPISP